MAAYQQELKKHYNKMIKSRDFKLGDLVLRKVNSGTKNPAHGKLGATWEGPYEIINIGGKGSYRLKNTKIELEVPKSVNISNLRIFYHGKV